MSKIQMRVGSELKHQLCTPSPIGVKRQPSTSIPQAIGRERKREQDANEPQDSSPPPHRKCEKIRPGARDWRSMKPPSSQRAMATSSNDKITLAVVDTTRTCQRKHCCVFPSGGNHQRTCTCKTVRRTRVVVKRLVISAKTFRGTSSQGNRTKFCSRVSREMLRGRSSESTPTAT